MLLYKKIMRRHIISIIITTLFLIISTYVWFNFKVFDISYKEMEKENIEVSNQVAFSSLEKVSDKNISDLTSYNFDVTNTGNAKEDIKITIVPDILTKNINNNYIKYSINNTDIKSLNTDGIIYLDSLNELETKNFDLKIWISETYSGDLNYNGRVIIS